MIHTTKRAVDNGYRTPVGNRQLSSIRRHFEEVNKPLDDIHREIIIILTSSVQGKRYSVQSAICRANKDSGGFTRVPGESSNSRPRFVKSNALPSSQTERVNLRERG